MFENDDDMGLDVDDEFLNVVFETEERHNNNKALQINGKFSSDSTIKLSLALPVQSCSRDQQVHEYFDPNHASSSNRSSVGHHLPQIGGFHLNHKGFDVGDKENKRKASPPPSRAKRERKFPGPAGLLPDRKSSRGTPLKLDKLPEVESPSASTSEELCSQGRLSGSVLEEGPWQNLIVDLGRHADMLDVVNIASVKRKAAARCFVGRKVPLLIAALHHLDVSSADPCIILRDSTGEIHGTLHREVWQQFAGELVVGSVLVIRNVGLLSTGISSRRHYLNITTNNLATIYSANPDKPQKTELHSLTSHDYAKTVENWRSLVASPKNMESPSSSLFNTSLSSSLSSSPAHSPQMNIPPHPNGTKQPQIPHVPNTRPTTIRNTLVHGHAPVTPPYSKTNPQFRATGKNLFSSGSNSHSSNQAQRSSSVSPYGRLNTSNSSLARNSFNNSFQSHPAPIPSTSGKPNSSLSNTSKSFNFNPVQSTNLKQSTSIIEPRKDGGYRCLNNSTRIILSQSSPLTLEEQSAVESMFEGLDADSLFDDDF